jgi:glycosyltransferase involved in cell wall biosynthesis
MSSQESFPLCYVAYPNSPDLRSANAVQTYHTLRELRRLAPGALVIVPRMRRGPSAFDELGAVHLPRIGIGRLSRLYRSTLLYYAERTAFAWMAAAYLLWRRLARRERYRVVYVREVILAFWLALLLPRLTGARVVYEVHDLETRNPSRARERWAAPLLGLLDRITLARPAALASLTAAFREQLVRDGVRPARQVAVLPDAYDAACYVPRDRDAARAALGLPLDATLVVYAGLTFSYRGLDLLLDALADARRMRPDLQAVLVGGRPQERAALEAQARRLGIAGAITFAGPQPQEAVPPFLAAGDILAVPDTVTDVTASPLKLFEYMAMRRAVVCPDLPALREITHGDGALHVARGDRTALAAALVRLAADPALRAELGARAAKRVALHTYARRAARLLAVCRAVADAPTVSAIDIGDL